METLRQWLRHRWAVRACQLVIGAIFAVSALAKLGDMQAFATQVHYFQMIPHSTENLLAMLLPWVELSTGLALILGIRRRAGAVLAAAMMTVFTLAIVTALVRGLDIECGCFGTADGAEVGLKKLAENVGMLAVALVASLNPR